MQKYYIKMIEFRVKREKKKKGKLFSCPLQITAASHTQMLERIVFVPGTTGHEKSRITHRFVGSCKAEFLGQEDAVYPATTFNPGLSLRKKHLQVPEQELL